MFSRLGTKIYLKFKVKITKSLTKLYVNIKKLYRSFQNKAWFCTINFLNLINLCDSSYDEWTISHKINKVIHTFAL